MSTVEKPSGVSPTKQLQKKVPTSSTPRSTEMKRTTSISPAKQKKEAQTFPPAQEKSPQRDLSMKVVPSLVASAQKTKDEALRVKALKSLLVEHTIMEAKFFEDVHALEMKYEKLYAPIHHKRRMIVTGEMDPSAICQDTKREDASRTSMEASKQNPSKGISNFWLIALQNSPNVGSIIEPNDIKVLAHLIDIQVVCTSEPMGFRLNFHFSPNKYFTNEVLTKTYELKCVVDNNDPFSFDGPEIVKSKGCTIDWKKGMNYIYTQRKKKQKIGNEIRMTKKTVKNNSFFNFFDPPTVGENEQKDYDTELALEEDFKLGRILRDRLVPEAVLYYTGEIHESESEESVSASDEDNEGEVESSEEEEEGGGDEVKPIEDSMKILEISEPSKPDVVLEKVGNTLSKPPKRNVDAFQNFV